MFPTKHPAIYLSLAALLATLTACANSPVAKNLEQSLAADPNLKDNPITLGPSPTPQNSQNEPKVDLPSDFPTEIPRYTNAELAEVTLPSEQSDSNTNAPQGTVTRWQSADPVNFVQNFYQKQLQDGGWQLETQPTDQAGGTLQARRNDLKITVSMQPIQNNPTNSTATPTTNPIATEFTIEYLRDNSNNATKSPGETTAVLPTPNPTDSPTSTPTPTPTTEATPTPQATNTPSNISASATVFTDLNKAPAELRSYISDLGRLGVLKINSSASKENQTNIQFEPNKTVTRREYARWLAAANNQIYSSQQPKQIRLANDSNQPAFADVPKTHPDFPAIQGLAEAGIIPSSLSGDSTALLFRPDAPLTREQMILWKMPLDNRQLPGSGTFEAVKQTWGFQDATKIDPKALRAIIGDFQNGDNSNIRRIFGFTTLFQPKKPVTRAEAAASLWYFGTESEGLSAKEALQVKQQ